MFRYFLVRRRYKRAVCTWKTLQNLLYSIKDQEIEEKTDFNTASFIIFICIYYFVLWSLLFFVREFSSRRALLWFNFFYGILVRFFLCVFTFRARCKYFVDSTIQPNHFVSQSFLLMRFFPSSMHKRHTIHSTPTSSTSCSSLICHLFHAQHIRNCNQLSYNELLRNVFHAKFIYWILFCALSMYFIVVDVHGFGLIRMSLVFYHAVSNQNNCFVSAQFLFFPTIFVVTDLLLSPNWYQVYYKLNSIESEG